MTSSRDFFPVIGAFALCAIASQVGAQSDAGYPARPLRLVVPYAPGGSSDFTARVLQPALAEQFKQGRDQFAVGEVAAGPKDHQTLRWDDPLLAEANAQWIGEDRTHR